MVGTEGSKISTRFSVGDYRARRERQAGASVDVAEVADPRSAAFVWGAPFFLGRRVALVMDGRNSSGTPNLQGPFYVLG